MAVGFGHAGARVGVDEQLGRAAAVRASAAALQRAETGEQTPAPPAADERDGRQRREVERALNVLDGGDGVVEVFEESVYIRGIFLVTVPALRHPESNCERSSLARADLVSCSLPAG